ncbi:hypothetical protein E2I00_015164 [Balaenoptera physalus]|uniref:G-protein coupled receptors family 1 profile domain-containing protein n=1 Tax=Balaenoptera physalus TaxID=9770 RepID=A0A643BUH1_BALPH|nr:hypothetical protein E2I00_015164 [Balaenoptera physalus]
MVLGRNISMMTNFILLGFSEHPELQVTLFVLFLGIYFMTLAWNLGLIVLIAMESHLHFSTYFFLALKMLCNFFKEQKTISFVGCAAQFFLFIGMCTLEDSSPDWSKPALYSDSISVGHESLTIFSVTCHHCWSCLVLVVNFIVVCTVGGTSAFVVLVSYGYIIAAVMKIHSTQGPTKVFNTCSFHLTTVILFYGSGLFSYLHSSAGYSLDQDKVVSMLYGAVIPMLSPIIYSLRNKEIKDALKKLKERKKQMSSLCLIVP